MGNVYIHVSDQDSFESRSGSSVLNGCESGSRPLSTEKLLILFLIIISKKDVDPKKPYH